MPDASKMPARIWVETVEEPWALWSIDKNDGDTPYIRADIAEQMAEALRDAKHWASTRCPVHTENPDPCPLCGATVDGRGLDGVCKAVEAIFPKALLAQVRAALQAYEAAQ